MADKKKMVWTSFNIQPKIFERRPLFQQAVSFGFLGKSVECGTGWGNFPHMRAKIPHFVPSSTNCKFCNLTGFNGLIDPEIVQVG